MCCSLADSTPSSEAVDGFFVAKVNHGFERRGLYTVQITMRNRISEEVDTIEERGPTHAELNLSKADQRHASFLAKSGSRSYEKFGVEILPTGD